MSEKIYHYKKGLPHQATKITDKAKAIGYEFAVKYGRHAIKAAQTDRYGVIDLPKSIKCAEAKVVEVGLRAGELSKVLYQVSYNAMYNLSLVINPDGFVRTVWLNRKDDTHETVDLTKYEAI